MTPTQTTRVSYSIPYTCQFASPEHVAAFINGQMPLTADPRWSEYGADNPDQYAHWALRSCGVVCVKMAAEALGSPRQSVMAWIQAGLAIDGYLTEHRDQRPVEKGWKHIALVQLAQQHGYHAEPISNLTLADLPALIRADRCLIASVSSEIGEGADVPITRSNGHLVVVHGFIQDIESEEDQAANLTHLILHNPSGRTPNLRENARIPADRFAAAFSGRGIVIGPHSQQT